MRGQVRGLLCECFATGYLLYGEELLVHHPTLKLEDHPLSAVRDRLFSTFAATLHVKNVRLVHSRSVTLSEYVIDPLTSNDHYSGRTAPLTSKRCILYIYSTNIGTEYFKHGIRSPSFSLQNAVFFTILTYLVPVLFNFIYRVC